MTGWGLARCDGRKTDIIDETTQVYSYFTRGSCSYLVQALMFRFALVNLLKNSFVWRVSGRRGPKFNISSIWFFIKRKIQVMGWIDGWWKQPLLLLLQPDFRGLVK